MPFGQPNLDIIITKIKNLQKGQSIIYHMGPTAFFRDHPQEKAWVLWVEDMQAEGLIDFTQRRVLCGPQYRGPNLYEYIARRRHERAEKLVW